MMGPWSDGGGWMGFGYFFMIAFWALVVVGIVALVRWLMSQSGTRDRRGKTALEILQERYARGEIGRDEYEQKKKDLPS